MKSKDQEFTFFIVAGEPSGDLHGAKLINAIKAVKKNARFVGHGGEQMKKSGLEMMYHTDNLAVMGFSEVIKHFPFLLNVMGESLGKLRELRPDRIILIDYPGFNLRLAKNASGLNIPISYFILPQLWAWKENRIKSFHKYIDQALSIFPFEQDWYRSKGVNANYLGHPFTEIESDQITRKEYLEKNNISKNEVLLVLLPGSRQQEIDRHFSLYLEAAKNLQKDNKKIRIIIGKSSGVKLPGVDSSVLIETKNIKNAMEFAKAAIVTSGTVSLECAVLDTPQIVCYKLSTLSGYIAKKLNKAPYISMVNLIAKTAIVPELIQGKVSIKNIMKEIEPLLYNRIVRKKMLEGYTGVRKSLGLPGVYERAAQVIIKRTENAKS